MSPPINLFKFKWGSCLSTVDSTGSGCRSVISGSLSPISGNVAGVSLLVCRREDLCCVPGAVALGRRISVPEMRGCQGLADDRWALVVFRMRAQGVGHSGHGLRPQPNPASAVVCRGVVHDQSEARSKRTWASTVTGSGKLSNSMDDLAEAAHGHGSAWARSFVRSGRGR